MIRVGLLGCGYMGRTHIKVYKLISLIKDVKLYGVCDVRNDVAIQCSKHLNSKVYSNADEMISDPQIDVIDICLPTYLHTEFAKKAILAGKSLFIEKPVTFDLNEAYELIELKEKTKAKIMIGQCVRLSPAYVYLKKIYDEKKYGNLKRLSLRRNSSNPSWGWENWYNDNKKSGGAIFDLHIHDIDFARYLMGEPSYIKSFGDSSYIRSILTYNNGTMVEIENGWDFPKAFPFSAGYRADFEDATLTLKGKDVDIYEQSGRLLQVTPDDDYPDDRISEKISNLGGYFHELDYFYDCLINDKEIEIASLEEAVKSVELIHKEIERMKP